MPNGVTGYNNVPQAVLQPRKPGENLRVAQVVLKRREHNLHAAAERAKQISQVKKDQKALEKGDEIKRLESIVLQSRQRRQDKSRLKNVNKRQLKCSGHGLDPAALPMLLVARNCKRGLCQSVNKTMQKKRLGHHHSWMFLSGSTANLKMLERCKPFLFWGKPTFKNTFDLVHKKLSIWKLNEEGQKEPILVQDNNLVEEQFGHLGLLCTEDLAYCIHNGDSNFDEVKHRVLPMKMGSVMKTNGLLADVVHRSGEQDDEEFNNLVAKMMG